MHDEDHGHRTVPKKETYSDPMKHMNHNAPMGHTGYDHHAMMINDFRKRFYAVLILTVPIVSLSPMIQHWLNVH